MAFRSFRILSLLSGFSCSALVRVLLSPTPLSPSLLFSYSIRSTFHGNVHRHPSPSLLFLLLSRNIISCRCTSCPRLPFIPMKIINLSGLGDLSREPKRSDIVRKAESGVYEALRIRSRDLVGEPTATPKTQQLS